MPFDWLPHDDPKVPAGREVGGGWCYGENITPCQRVNGFWFSPATDCLTNMRSTSHERKPVPLCYSEHPWMLPAAPIPTLYRWHIWKLTLIITSPLACTDMRTSQPVENSAVPHLSGSSLFAGLVVLFPRSSVPTLLDRGKSVHQEGHDTKQPCLSVCLWLCN